MRTAPRLVVSWLAVLGGLTSCGDACPSGSRPTNDGRCVPIEIDGAMDAGGVLDGSLEAGSAETGAVDARAGDGALGDAARVDGNTPIDLDGGPIDAGPPDTGPIDARVCDAAETRCDGRDDDCDDIVDEGVLTTYYRDNDRDTYGAAAMTTTACTEPSGYVANAMDCDDDCVTCVPGGTEACDFRDNDCDTMIDEGTRLTFYRDADGDTYGTTLIIMTGCTAPTGYVVDNTDCNDACATCRPGAAEVCDSLDNDCDTRTDEGVLNTYYWDYDFDMYGDATITMLACSRPERWASMTGDCDNADAQRSPGLSESCDEKDNDCDTRIDEGVPVSTQYADCDRDGFSFVGATTVARCRPPTSFGPSTCPSGRWTATAPVGATIDCHDGDGRAFPGQSAYASTPRPDGSYDFNCDNSATVEITTTLGSCNTIMGTCVPRFAWTGTSVPACGASATFVNGCTGTCSATTTSRSQACR